MTRFTLSDCELDFGNICLGGDFTLTIKTDDGGRSFNLVDAESCLKGVSKRAFALIEEWIEDDTAPRQRKAEHKSRVRAAYDDHVWQHENVSARFHVEAPVDLSLIGRAA